MQFNTFIFILFFLPIVLAGYFISGKFSCKYSNIYLAVMSCFFYGYSGVRTLIMFTSVVVGNYIFVKLLHKKTADKSKKIILSLGIIANICILAYFKYYNFFVENINIILKTDFNVKNIILPLAISFFVFQEIAYLIETYKGNTRDFLFVDYFLYMLFFPKLLMGPLVMPQDLIPQLRCKDRKKLDIENLIVGIRMFNIGLFKKAILADTFAKAVNWGMGNSDIATSVDLLIVMVVYTFQIYLDFCGYSDMAIGISKMMNIELPVNFNSPYKAISIKDFWSRWHMSLTRFLTDYIYIPLGGNRKGVFRTYINIIVVFLISGMWHGANWTFILWGGLHGVLQVVERAGRKAYSKIHLCIKWMMTFILVNILWLLFRADTVQQWISMLASILEFENFTISDGLLNCFNLPEVVFLMHHFPFSYMNTLVRGFPMFCFLISVMVGCLCMENTYKRKYSKDLLSPIVSAILFCWSLISLSGESVFIYNNF